MNLLCRGNSIAPIAIPNHLERKDSYYYFDKRMERKVLVLGANGLFGSRITRLFAASKPCSQLEILVGCRTKGKAIQSIKELLESFPGKGKETNPLKNIVFTPLEIGSVGGSDTREFQSLLKQSNPSIVINTIGPFVFNGNENDPAEFPSCYSIARECANQSVHYIDLADQRLYLNRFREYLSPIAKKNSVSMIAGASTTPGITMGVMDLLVKGNSNSSSLYDGNELGKLESVKWYLNPGNKIGDKGTGYATVVSILNTILEPIYTPGSTCNFHHRAWESKQSFPFRWLPGSRYVSRVNQSDIDMVGDKFSSFQKYPSTPIEVECYAGVEKKFMMTLLILTGKLISGFPFLKDVVAKSAFLTRRIGTDEGGFSVIVKGSLPSGENTERRWDLLASKGNGPFIPAIPAFCVAENLLEGQTSKFSGAYVCSNETELFSFSDFDNVVKRQELSLFWSIFDEQSDRSPSLYKRILGSSYYRMPKQIREVHDNDIEVSGHCKIEGPVGVVGTLVAKIAGLPSKGNDVPVTVRLSTEGNKELWKRNFGGTPFETVQSDVGLVEETSVRSGVLSEGISSKYGIGKMDAHAVITCDANGLYWDVKEFRIGWFKLPSFLGAPTKAVEAVSDGKFQFDVSIDLPFGFGRLVHYKGLLTPVEHKE